MPSMIDIARAQMKPVDYVILVLTESFREQQQPVDPKLIASQIGGAPVKKVAERMDFLHRKVQVLEFQSLSYMVSALGAELLALDLLEWSPSPTEQERRDAFLASAQAGRARR